MTLRKMRLYSSERRARFACMHATWHLHVFILCSYFSDCVSVSVEQNDKAALAVSPSSEYATSYNAATIHIYSTIAVYVYKVFCRSSSQLHTAKTDYQSDRSQLFIGVASSFICVHPSPSLLISFTIVAAPPPPPSICLLRLQRLMCTLARELADRKSDAGNNKGPVQKANISHGGSCVREQLGSVTKFLIPAEHSIGYKTTRDSEVGMLQTLLPFTF